MDGVGGVRLDLGSQALDVHIQGLGVPDVVRAPHPVDEPGEQMLKRYKKETEESTAVRDLMPVRFVPLLPDTTKDPNDMKSAGSAA